MHIMHMYHIVIMKFILLKSQENNLAFDMANNTVVHEQRMKIDGVSMFRLLFMPKTQGCY